MSNLFEFTLLVPSGPHLNHVKEDGSMLIHCHPRARSAHWLFTYHLRALAVALHASEEDDRGLLASLVYFELEPGTGSTGENDIFGVKEKAEG